MGMFDTNRTYLGAQPMGPYQAAKPVDLGQPIGPVPDDRGPSDAENGMWPAAPRDISGADFSGGLTSKPTTIASAVPYRNVAKNASGGDLSVANNSSYGGMLRSIPDKGGVVAGNSGGNAVTNDQAKMPQRPQVDLNDPRNAALAGYRNQ